jgi:aryl-alcohol dehydrogenase-like predicted oxidoreductase
MFPLLADQGTGSVPWSPLAGGLLARPWGEQGTTRGRLTPATDEVSGLEEHYTPRKPTYYGSKSGY